MTCIILLALATAMSVIVVNVLGKGQMKDNYINPKGNTDALTWWRRAILLDRFFLFVYLLVTVALVIWILVMATR